MKMKWYPWMKSCSYLLVFLLAWLISLSPNCIASGVSLGTHPNSNIQCIQDEREALLQFKQGIEDDECGLLTSWVGQECCGWHGIHCRNRSGHVVSLNLGWTMNQQGLRIPEGKPSPSLLKLKHLKNLDLSFNYFWQPIPFPSFIGALHCLRYLNLSFVGFQGEIPVQLANLSSLTSLDLSDFGQLE